MYTEDKFAEQLTNVINNSQLYTELVDVEDTCSVSNTLHALQLDALWSRIVWHAVSQHGIEKFTAAFEDDAALSELFDWHVTEEGWNFWNAVNRLVT